MSSLKDRYPNASVGELFFLGEIEKGYLTIDDNGYIWRHFYYLGGGKWLEQPKRAESRESRGYLALHKNNDGKGKNFYAKAHRIVYLVHFGDIPNGLETNHKNAIRDDNRPDNLEMVTHTENIRHAMRLGLLRPQQGERQWNSKLTEEQVHEIRKLRKQGFLLREIADKFKVAIPTVCHITCRDTWRHIE